MEWSSSKSKKSQKMSPLRCSCLHLSHKCKEDDSRMSSRTWADFLWETLSSSNCLECQLDTRCHHIDTKMSPFHVHQMFGKLVWDELRSKLGHGRRHFRRWRLHRRNRDFIIDIILFDDLGVLFRHADRREDEENKEDELHWKSIAQFSWEIISL